MRIIFSLIIIICSFASFYDLSSDYEYTVFKINNYEVKPPTSFTYDKIYEKMKKDYEEIKSKNNDVVAIIDVPNVCYQPVVFTGDQFYLRKDLNKKYKIAGTLFLGAYTDGNFDDNAIIYGHHMRDGTMFASLKLYRDEYFFRDNEPIKVFDGKSLRFYKPYTSLIITDGKEKACFGGRIGKEREDFYKNLYNRSSVKMEDGLHPDYSKDMLFLQTCEYDYDGARHLVGAYLIKEIEK